MRDTIIKEAVFFENYLVQRYDLIEFFLNSIEDKSKSEVEIRKSKYFLFQQSLEIFIAKYSSGIEIENLKKEIPKLIDSLIDGWFDQERKLYDNINNITLNQYELNSYNYLIWTISLAIIFRIEKDTIEQLQTLIEDGGTNDNLLLKLLSSLNNKDYDKGNVTSYNPFEKLYYQGSLLVSSEEMKRYLSKWYSNTKLHTWHNYKKHIHKPQYSYFGYWSFESAALTCILDLDDSSYRNNQYYPKDLVDYYRSTS